MVSSASPIDKDDRTAFVWEAENRPPASLFPSTYAPPFIDDVNEGEQINNDEPAGTSTLCKSAVH